MNVVGSQLWFTDLWNYSIIPYMIDALRDTSQVAAVADIIIIIIINIIIIIHTTHTN